MFVQVLPAGWEREGSDSRGSNRTSAIRSP